MKLTIEQYEQSKLILLEAGNSLSQLREYYMMENKYGKFISTTVGNVDIRPKEYFKCIFNEDGDLVKYRFNNTDYKPKWKQCKIKEWIQQNCREVGVIKL